MERFSWNRNVDLPIALKLLEIWASGVAQATGSVLC
jgi:hypothetical protein